MLKKHHRKLVEYARSIGYEDPRIEPGRHHPQFVGRIAGREVRKGISGSPHDREMLCARADLRRFARRG